MATILILSLSFLCGLICAGMESWRAWAPSAAASGLLVGVSAKLLGVM